MFKKRKIKIRRAGFTLIEALTLLFLFSIIFVTFYQVIGRGTYYLNYSKSQLGALAVANEKMEIARNLDYAAVGATNEAVSGNIPQDEDVTENGQTYHVHTLVTYVDDPFDGTLGGSPSDSTPEDYKLVEITVSWNAGGPNAGSVSLTSRFVPPGLEIADPNAGILSINVLGSNGTAVAGAAVQIVNADTNINETLQTDSAGNVTLVGAPTALQNYQITVSKGGYETVSTMPPFSTTPYNPTYPYQSVMAGSLTTVNIIEDKTSNLTISTVGPTGQAVPNISYDLTGGRVLGTQVTVPYTPVYDLTVTDQTDSSGQKSYTAISPGQYTFTLDQSETGYVLVGTEPVLPLSLVPGQNLSLQAEVASTTATSALVKVTDSSDGAAITGASVELSNGSGYDETLTTDGNGTAYFPTATDTTFAAGDYTLKVSAGNYQTVTQTITVGSGALLQVPVSLISG